MHRDTIDLLAGITYDMMNWTRFSLPSVRVSDRKWKKKQVKEEQVEERRGPKETLEHHRIWLEVPGGFCASSPSELWKSLCVSSFGDCRFSFLFSLFFFFSFFRLFSFSFFFIYLSIYFFFFFFDASIYKYTKDVYSFCFGADGISTCSTLAFLENLFFLFKNKPRLWKKKWW